MMTKYRGSNKHKNRPTGEVKGTLCPEWTHGAEGKGYGYDPYGHDWERTEARRMFTERAPDPEGGKRAWATGRGVAFAAHPTGDGTWHGYPVPWSSVPAELKDRWLESKKVSRRDVKRYNEPPENSIDWALETDDD